MIRAKASYRDKKLELDRTLDLQEGTEVIIHVYKTPTPEQEDQAFRDLGMQRIAEKLDNPEDAIYDDWKKLYGVEGG